VSAQRRALALAFAIACVVFVTKLALATLALSRADALALDALASAVVLALAAGAIACFAPAPVGVRLGLGAGSLGAAQVALATLGIVGLSHAAEAAVRLLGLSSPGLVRFDDALAGLALVDAAFPLLAIGLASAAGEELFFRGAIQRGVATRLGTPAAIAVAALAFGVAHGDWLHGAAAAVLGAYLGIVAARADSIRPAVVAHAANNVVALLEKAGGWDLPAGPVATPLCGIAGVTLACVALATLRKARREDFSVRRKPPMDTRDSGC